MEQSSWMIWLLDGKSPTDELLRQGIAHFAEKYGQAAQRARLPISASVELEGTLKAAGLTVERSQYVLAKDVWMS